MAADDPKSASDAERSSGRFGASRGRLKMFIGAAPGVGKTYTMLRQADALKERGVDVVIGYVDVHDRPDTAKQIRDIEVLPRRQVTLNERVFEEFDVDAVAKRRPEAVVVDELAHSNVPGSRFPKRYMDVEFLLEQGIDVLTAVNVQHLEDVREEAEKITGVKIREVIPTSFVKKADEIEVIDVTPETLRQRLRDGSIYPLEKVTQALTHFFRKSNLSALRELALREVAEDVDERLQRSYDRVKIPGPVGAKETILVCINFLPRSVKLLRKASRLADRMNADLFVLTILETPEGDLSQKGRHRLEKLRAMAAHYGATEYIVEPRNERPVGSVIAEVADRRNVTQIVIGQPSETHKWALWKDHPVRYLLRNLRYIDLHIVGWKDERRQEGMQNVVSAPDGERAYLPGRLTIYVGAAPGVGKTFKMLQDANDWRSKGQDVVIGLIETHGRAETAAQIGDLEIIPKRIIEFEGRQYEELDVAGILKRRPQIVLIDELAHSNVPGSDREKRYQDIEFLLEQGVDVVTAVNIQHLESLRDKVEHITGIKVRERVPDSFMALAWQVKLIDVAPETLQQRLIDVKIYAPDKIERALNNFFRIGNLSALREIALLEVADDVEKRRVRLRGSESAEGKRRRGASTDPILVCVNYRPHSEKLIRRGWRLANRHNAPLCVLVVIAAADMTNEEKRDLERIENLSEQFEAAYVTRTASKKGIGATIVEVADELHASQIVIGQPLPATRWLARWEKNPVDYVLEHAVFVNLHVVSNARAANR